MISMSRLFLLVATVAVARAASVDDDDEAPSTEELLEGIKQLTGACESLQIENADSIIEDIVDTIGDSDADFSDLGKAVGEALAGADVNVINVGCATGCSSDPNGYAACVLACADRMIRARGRIRRSNDGTQSDNPCDQLVDAMKSIGSSCQQRTRRLVQPQPPDESEFGSGRRGDDHKSSGGSGDDRDLTMQCMELECGAEQEACFGNEKCDDEFNEAMGNDGHPSLEGKSAEFLSLYSCMQKSCDIGDGDDKNGGGDDRDLTMQCMELECGAEQEACFGNEKCDDEFNEAMGNDSHPSLEGKSAEFLSLYSCMQKSCDIGDDDDKNGGDNHDIMQCMELECGTEREACDGNGKCVDEFNNAMGNDGHPSLDDKTAEFLTLYKCMADFCGIANNDEGDNCDNYNNHRSGSGSGNGNRETMECMALQCSSKQEACNGNTKCQDELETAMGNDGLPSLEDKSTEFVTLFNCMVDFCDILNDDDDKNGGRNDDGGDNTEECFATTCSADKQACDGSAECTKELKEEMDRSDDDRDGPPSTEGKSVEFGKLVTCYMERCDDGDRNDDGKNGGRNDCGRHDDDRNGGRGDDDDGNSEECFATVCSAEKQACDGSAECTSDLKAADSDDDRDGPPSTEGKSAEFGKLVTCYMTQCNDDEMSKCMIASCSSERNGCLVGSSKATCSVELATSMVAGNRPYAKGKSKAFGALLTCMNTNCGLPIMTEDVCAAVAGVANNPKLQDLLASEGVDVESLSKLDNDDGAASTSAQIVTIAVAASVGLLW